MAIALPPPPPPQQGPLAELRAEAGREPSFVVDYKGIRIQVFGKLLVPEARLRQGIEAADSLSNAVRSLANSYYYYGYPAPLLTYAADKSAQPAAPPTVYVRVVAARVSRVAGPPELLPYFADLPRPQPLTDAQLEADRAVADTAAARSGLQYAPEFKPDGADAVVLDLGPSRPGERRTAVAASFNNYGTRYAGPYLANAGLRQSFASSDELTLTGAASVRALGLGGQHSEPYHDGELGWTRIVGFGTAALQGRYATFRESAASVEFHGKLDELALGWQTNLYTSFSQRLSFNLRLLHDHEVLGEPSLQAAVNCTGLGSLLQQLGLETCMTVSNGGDAFSESYSSAELALGYRWRTLEAEHAFEVQAGWLLRKGLSAGIAQGSNADLSYLLQQPSLSLRYQLTPRWSLLANGNVQFSGGVMPQQQQYVIGGPSSLHAYLVGAGVGDRGGAASLATEWSGDADSYAGQHGLKPRVFVEYASATHRQAALGEPPGTVSLADAGAALEWRVLSGLGASLSVGRPIMRHGGQASPDQLQTRLLFFQLAAAY
jgi:hypothetical protein